MSKQRRPLFGACRKRTNDGNLFTIVLLDGAPVRVCMLLTEPGNTRNTTRPSSDDTNTRNDSTKEERCGEVGSYTISPLDYMSCGACSA